MTHDNTGKLSKAHVKQINDALVQEGITFETKYDSTDSSENPGAARKRRATQSSVDHFNT